MTKEEFARRGVQVRGFVNGAIVFDETAPVDIPEEIAERQMQTLVNLAEPDGVWMLEIIFADGEHVRLGTDNSSMVLPVPLRAKR
jgi:hypothetical protein